MTRTKTAVAVGAVCMLFGVGALVSGPAVADDVGVSGIEDLGGDRQRVCAATGATKAEARRAFQERCVGRDVADCDPAAGGGLICATVRMNVGDLIDDDERPERSVGGGVGHDHAGGDEIDGDRDRVCSATGHDRVEATENFRVKCGGRPLDCDPTRSGGKLCASVWMGAESTSIRDDPAPSSGDLDETSPPPLLPTTSRRTDVVETVDRPAGHSGGWARVFHDDFAGAAIDERLWTIEPSGWYSWTWRGKNVVVESGDLVVRTRHHRSERGGRTTYLSSGAVRSKTRFEKGHFYEARIKGAAYRPGVAPAFWLTDPGGLASAVGHGATSPGPRPDFDPADDYHVYGIHVTDDAAVWYVDGVEWARDTEVADHLLDDLYLVFSQQLQHDVDIDGFDVGAEAPPAEVRVDWVKVFEPV